MEKKVAKNNQSNTVKESYKAEIERLKLFNARWNNFVSSIVKKYPTDETRKLNFVSEMITEILSSTDNPDYSLTQKIEEIYKIIDDGKEIKFDKKRSLFDESESGFNMEEVLNPGKLDLMSLCKELGATD